VLLFSAHRSMERKERSHGELLFLPTIALSVRHQGQDIQTLQAGGDTFQHLSNILPSGAAQPMKAIATKAKP